jgi:hypothetical protein
MCLFLVSLSFFATLNIFFSYMICNTMYLGRDHRPYGSKLTTFLSQSHRTFSTVLRPAQEYFTYMGTSPLSVKGCKILACAQRSGPLSREGSLSCHTCCYTGPRFFRSLPKDRPIQSPLKTLKGMWRICSNPDSHGSHRYEQDSNRHGLEVRGLVVEDQCLNHSATEVLHSDMFHTNVLGLSFTYRLP